MRGSRVAVIPVRVGRNVEEEEGEDGGGADLLVGRPSAWLGCGLCCRRSWCELAGG